MQGEEKGEEKNLPWPAHVAIIMDGNGRWAEKRGLSRLSGHRAGMEAMKKIVRKSAELGIAYLTVYAFSTENWKRSAEEVNGIFSLLVRYVASTLQELVEENVRVRVFGSYEELPESAVNSLKKLIKSTENNTGLQFNVAVNYGARKEIVRAVNTWRKSGEEADLTEAALTDALYSGRQNGRVPDPDLIIRTGGEKRLSNFLLWQAAYSEFIFSDTLWPDFTPEEFVEKLEEFSRRDRRFGGRR